MLGTRQMMTCSLTHTQHVAVSPPTTAPPRGFPDRSGLPSLIWLYLYKNKITEIGEGDLVNIPSLEILRIYDNSISKVRVVVLTRTEMGPNRLINCAPLPPSASHPTGPCACNK